MTPYGTQTLLDALARSGSTISDATTTMPLRDIATRTVAMTGLLDDRGILVADCVAFDCSNDVPSASVLLALLASGRNFVLRPDPLVPAAPDSDTPIAEAFCRYRVQASANGTIAVTRNPSWRANLPDGPAWFCLPTSGSTGGAKLVRHRQERLLQAARTCTDRLGLRPGDRVAIPVPIAHMFGLGAAFVPAVLAGASIDLQSHSNVLRYFAAERRFDPNVAFLTPNFGDAIARLRKTRREYRLTVMAGDRLTEELFDRYERQHGCLVNLYGSTELGAIAAGHPGDPAELRRSLVGRLLPGVSLRRAADPAVADTLWFGHEFGFECYTDAEGRAVPEADGSPACGACYRSNDIGRLVDGYLEIFGRVDDLVNRDGVLIACADVAAGVRTIDGIADAVVLAGEMSRRGRELIAFCVPAGDTHWEPAALRKACLDALPAQAAPDRFVFLADLPRLASGKVDRIALRHHHGHRIILTDA